MLQFFFGRLKKAPTMILFCAMLIPMIGQCNLEAKLEECPDNARCVGKVKQLYKLWSKQFESVKNSKQELKRLQNEIGFPLKLWAIPNQVALNPKTESIPTLLWESANPIHQKTTPSIQIALSFVKNDNQNHLKDQGLFFDQGLVLFKNQEKPINIFLPRDEIPYFFNEQKAFYIGEFEGQFFYYSMEKNKLQFELEAKTEHNPERLPCSQKMLKALEINPTPWGHRPVCHLIWEQTSKTFIELGRHWGGQ